MEVLALGMSRTGTYSMYTALQILGLKSMHMAELRFTPPGTHALWLKGLEAKYHGKGKKYGKAELDKLLGEYSAITDIPCIMFTEELLAAYPDAKVLITTRDEETWLWSISTLFNTLLRWRWDFISSYDTIKVKPYIEILTLIWNHLTGGNWDDKTKLRQSFHDHYALVRTSVPKDKLLVFDPKQGWEPLCKHLGKPVPQEPYPHLNELPVTIAIHKAIWWDMTRRAMKEIILKSVYALFAKRMGSDLDPQTVLRNDDFKSINFPTGEKPVLLLWGRYTGGNTPSGYNPEGDSDLLGQKQLLLMAEKTLRTFDVIIIGHDPAGTTENDWVHAQCHVGEFYPKHSIGPNRGRQFPSCLH
ncbi:hypothetical protein JMJ35_003662 [Cladonia borealis]|uniref:Uncharacterized protein n=1 Tax=Cladonia borealis TaxID=184061 RepID=A0AA39R334_9LECA|nr:hypothetical protein JMJ35_003662 [Cladonia borealis]